MKRYSVFVILFVFVQITLLSSCDYFTFRKQSKERQDRLSEKIDSLKIEYKKIDDDLKAAQQILDNYVDKDSLLKSMLDSAQLNN